MSQRNLTTASYTVNFGSNTVSLQRYKILKVLSLKASPAQPELELELSLEEKSQVEEGG